MSPTGRKPSQTSSPASAPTLNERPTEPQRDAVAPKGWPEAHRGDTPFADTRPRAHPGPGDPALGQILDGRFQLRRLLARGGMSAVYVAWDERFEVEVAVKLQSIDGEPELRAEAEWRFEAEAKLLARLTDPRILKPITWGRADHGQMFLVSELLRGETLADRIHRTGKMAFLEVLQLMADTARGLAEAHAAGVVHRDVKPGNLFLQRSAGGGSILRILDFGVAKLLRASDTCDGTEPGVVIGTVPYLSPEQAMGHVVGPATDLYALGVVAYQCLTGQVPFTGTATEVLFAHIREEPPLMAEVDVPPEVEDLVMQLLAKAPERRPASAGLVADRAEALIKQLDPNWPTVSERVNLISDSTPAARRSWPETVLLFASSAVIVFAGLDGWARLRGESPSPPAPVTAKSEPPAPFPPSMAIADAPAEKLAPSEAPHDRPQPPPTRGALSQPTKNAHPRRSRPSTRASARVHVEARLGLPASPLNERRLERLRQRLAACLRRAPKAPIEVAIALQPDGRSRLQVKGDQGFKTRAFERCATSRTAQLAFELNDKPAVLRLRITRR